MAKSQMSVSKKVLASKKTTKKTKESTKKARTVSKPADARRNKKTTKPTTNKPNASKRRRQDGAKNTKNSASSMRTTPVPLPLPSAKKQIEYYNSYRPDLARSLRSDKVPAQQKYVTVNQHLYWGPSTLSEKMGNGVFSSKFLKKGDVVEISPLIVDCNTHWEPMSSDPALHEDYTHEYSVKHAPRIYHGGKASPKNRRMSALMLGYGSLYNSSENPNCELIWTADKTGTVIATGNIEPHTELFISYGQEWFDDRNDYIAQKE